jgi:hypothetical protein
MVVSIQTLNTRLIYLTAAVLAGPALLYVLQALALTLMTM